MFVILYGIIYLMGIVSGGERVKTLLWNVNKNPNVMGVLSDYVRDNQIDVLCVIEHPSDEIYELGHLEFRSKTMKSVATIAIYCSKSYTVSDIHVSDRMLGFSVTSKELEKVYIWACHIPSKLHCDENRQLAHISILKDNIAMYEKKLSSKRTILIGDFNASPFENSLSTTNGIISVSSLKDAQRTMKRIKKNVEFFYNPMWNYFGDMSSPPGTYYYDKSFDPAFWYIFDQVIYRPNMAKFIPLSRLKILTNLSHHELLDDGIPNLKYSDHLPIQFEIMEDII